MMSSAAAGWSYNIKVTMVGAGPAAGPGPAARPLGGVLKTRRPPEKE